MNLLPKLRNIAKVIQPHPDHMLGVWSQTNEKVLNKTAQHSIAIELLNKDFDRNALKWQFDGRIVCEFGEMINGAIAKAIIEIAWK